MEENKTQEQVTRNLPGTLSTAVLLRGLGQEEMDRLMGIYRANRRAHYKMDKTAYLSQEITEQEKLFLVDYLSTRLTMRELCEKHDIPVNSGHHRLQRVMARYLYQHKEEVL